MCSPPGKAKVLEGTVFCCMIQETGYKGREKFTVCRDQNSLEMVRMWLFLPAGLPTSKQRATTLVIHSRKSFRIPRILLIGSSILVILNPSE
ncbi:hypothetical protein AVEN_28885-1 [Araneus ventricosus]|uniref:Uncharacterized protein n=1 Tax=Araneus ventricosus TaxID=182803 RepID=A0A4Y2AIV9_ARAVE|nr:hypothetical protein AVEN_28885-1 [Araneus ventricosus]